MMNAGLAVDLPQLDEAGAEGIGLFRTELQFMVASTFPRAEAQEKLYADVLNAARGKPVTFRTLDIGGDKVLPYLRHDGGDVLQVAFGGDRLLQILGAAALHPVPVGGVADDFLFLHGSHMPGVNVQRHTVLFAQVP